MKLTELNPTLKENILVFDCPNCTGDNQHRIRVPLKPHEGMAWDHDGVFPDTITLRPSIDAGCFHKNIVNGEIV